MWTTLPRIDCEGMRTEVLSVPGGVVISRQTRIGDENISMSLVYVPMSDAVRDEWIEQQTATSKKAEPDRTKWWYTIDAGTGVKTSHSTAEQYTRDEFLMWLQTMNARNDGKHYAEGKKG